MFWPLETFNLHIVFPIVMEMQHAELFLIDRLVNLKTEESNFFLTFVLSFVLIRQSLCQ